MIAVSACLVLLGSGVALAQGHDSGKGPNPHGGMGRSLGPVMDLLHKLELTEEQQDQLRATVHEHMGGKLGKLTHESLQMRRQLERLIHNPAAEEDAILEAVHQVGLNGEQIALERHRLTLAIDKVLTVEQRQQLQEMLDKNPLRRARGLPSGG
jgi:Spy/CpxP family protein refolding chaperone